MSSPATGITNGHIFRSKVGERDRTTSSWSWWLLPDKVCHFIMIIGEESILKHCHKQELFQDVQRSTPCSGTQGCCFTASYWHRAHDGCADSSLKPPRERVQVILLCCQHKFHLQTFFLHNRSAVPQISFPESEAGNQHDIDHNEVGEIKTPQGRMQIIHKWLRNTSRKREDDVR